MLAAWKLFIDPHLCEKMKKESKGKAAGKVQGGKFSLGHQGAHFVVDELGFYS